MPVLSNLAHRLARPPAAGSGAPAPIRARARGSGRPRAARPPRVFGAGGAGGGRGERAARPPRAFGAGGAGGGRGEPAAPGCPRAGTRAARLRTACSPLG